MHCVTIWMTENCNLKCKYCYEGQEKEKKRFAASNIDALIMFIETELLETIEENDKAIISFHGGEPLLELQSMKRIVSELDKITSKKNISIIYEVTTNGNVNELEFLEYIRNRDDFKVSVSLDGKKEINDLFRVTTLGKGSFDKAYKFVKKLLIIGKNPRIRMTLTPEMVEYLYENIVFFVEEGFSMIVTVPDFFDKTWESSHLIKMEKQLHKIFEYRKKMSKMHLQISLIDKTSYLKNVGRCFGGIKEVHISCDGQLYPCTYTMNNTKYRIGDIWKGIDKKKQVELLTLYGQNNEECTGCGLENSCICTRCKFLNEAISGNSATPVPIICGFMNTLYSFFKDVNANSNSFI